jgi:hypothetical protein
MNIHEFDEQLNTIKAFHTYLSEVIDKGYNNNQEIIKLIVKNINEYIEQMTDLENGKDNDTEEEEEEEDEATQLENKLKLKIEKFLKSNVDLSKIYLYRKDNKYIDELNNFVCNSYLY